jgi:hypothetical protein
MVRICMAAAPPQQEKHVFGYYKIFYLDRQLKTASLGNRKFSIDRGDFLKIACFINSLLDVATPINRLTTLYYLVGLAG